MYKDFQKREPSKTERMLYELAMHQQMTDRNASTNSAFVAAIGLTLNVDPKTIAALLTTEHEKIKAYSDQINQEIERIEKERAPKKTEENSAENSTEQTEPTEGGNE